MVPISKKKKQNKRIFENTTFNEKEENKTVGNVQY